VYPITDKILSSNGGYNIYEGWAAVASISKNKQIKKRFYNNTHGGSEKAKKLAIKARVELEKEIKKQYK